MVTLISIINKPPYSCSYSLNSVCRNIRLHRPVHKSYFSSLIRICYLVVFIYNSYWDKALMGKDI